MVLRYPSPAYVFKNPWSVIPATPNSSSVLVRPILNKAAIPATQNIYTTDGTLTGSRVVNIGSFGLNFSGSEE